jgi:hypothetical protein
MPPVAEWIGQGRLRLSAVLALVVVVTSFHPAEPAPAHLNHESFFRSALRAVPVGELSAEQRRHIGWIDSGSIAQRTPLEVAEPGPMPGFELTGPPTERHRALRCLTEAIYYEAAREPAEGKRAVAQVVLNRVRHPAFPKSVCGVVYQGSARTTGCQFSFTCDGSLARRPDPVLWRQAQAVALDALHGEVAPEVGTATHYHADYVAPYWAPTLTRIAQLGAHIFYRWPGLAGEAAVFTGVYSPQETRIARSVLVAGDVEAPTPADLDVRLGPSLEPASTKVALIDRVEAETRTWRAPTENWSSGSTWSDTTAWPTTGVP